MRTLLVLLLVGFIGLVQAHEITRGDLPPEAREVLQRIETNSPHPYQRDGIVFGNLEKQLPRSRRGYYREYTVPTPGVSHRGARRIVCGGWDARHPEACWYSADHYRSFRKIAE